jgi:hypothetical protein
MQILPQSEVIYKRHVSQVKRCAAALQRENDGDILFYSTPPRNRPTLRFSEASFAEATRRDRQRPVNWTAA